MNRREQRIAEGMTPGVYVSELRNELAMRSRVWARGRLHVESYGAQPVVVYAPDGDRHGNFFNAAYEAIAAKKEWMRRFNKVHAQGKRTLPKPLNDSIRKWRTGLQHELRCAADECVLHAGCRGVT